MNNFHHFNDLTDSEEVYNEKKDDFFFSSSSSSLFSSSSSHPSSPNLSKVSSNVNYSYSISSSCSTRVSSTNSIYTLPSRNSHNDIMMSLSQTNKVFAEEQLASHSSSPCSFDYTQPFSSSNFLNTSPQMLSQPPVSSQPPVCSPTYPPVPTSIISPCKISHSPANNSQMTTPPSPSYKCRQLPCRTFISTGCCPYADRCVFLHDPTIMSKNSFAKIKVSREKKI